VTVTPIGRRLAFSNGGVCAELLKMDGARSPDAIGRRATSIWARIVAFRLLGADRRRSATVRAQTA